MADDILFAEQTAPLSFAEFLERMKEPAAADLVRSIKNFIKTFDDRPPDPDRDALSVQSFLVKSEAAFKQHPVWANVPPAHQAQAVEGLEKYLMTKIYHKVFAVSELDRERDESLTMRMSALGFIEPKHLDIPELYHDEKAWILARKELHKINNYKAPRDKLVCALNCCRVINNLLHVQVQGEARGADDFLPVLIYVVIHANPPQLASNLEYIQRFRMHSRMASESAYFFTQLYSAASFIETVNATSLTIDPDEFMARMVAAGVPDMQLVPSSAAMPLITRTSHSSLADALAASQNPPALDDQALLAEAAAQMQQSPAAGAAAPEGVSVGLSQAATRPGDESFMDIPAGAAMTIGALPLPGEASAGMLLTHNSAVEPSSTAVADFQNPLQDAQPPQLDAPLVSASGDKSLAPLDYAAAQAAMPAQLVPLPGADAATSLAPQAAVADEPLPESSLPMAMGSAAAPSMQYPSVADLERAGTELLLQAEASGRLKEQHTFLYAMAADLRVLDVDKLLSQYKELVLRYEALSLAAAQLHMQSQPTGPSSQPAAASSLHGSQPAAAPIASQLQPSAQLAGMGRDSPSHLLASRQPEKAHEPMFGAAQPASDVGVASSGNLAHLQEASDTAHDAAEAVLQPQTSAAFYDEQAGVGSQALHLGSSGAAAQQAQPLAEDDRFLSLARGEAQADATDVGTPPAEPPRAAHAAPASGEQQPDAGMDGGPSTHQQHPSDLSRESQQGQDGQAENQAPGQYASNLPIEVPPAGYAGDDEASTGQQGEPPDFPPAPRASGRNSISSTEATLARDDAELPAAEVSSSPVKNDGALPSGILIANPAFAAGAASATAPDKEAAGGGQGNGAARGSSGGPAPQGAAPEHAAPESEESSAANGGPHGAATSNDVDPFAETDAALHSNAESEKGSERAVSPQEAGSGLDSKPRATEEPPGTEDMFGGLTLTGAREGNSLI